MGQLDARLGRRSPSIGVLSKIPTVPPSEWDGTFNRRESDRLSSSRPATAAAFKGEIRRVVLVESDQYYREVLTEELLRQGFAVHPFADGAALLGLLGTVSRADLAVLDWDLPGMPGITLLAQLRQHGVKLPVVFLTGKVIATKQHERCVLAPRDALNAYECMAFDQGAVDFISKSRDRQVLVRRLRNVVELSKPRTNVSGRGAPDVRQARAEYRNEPRLLEPGRCRPHARGIQHRPSARVECRLFRDLSHALRPAAFRRLHRRDRE